jgi:hypothetical protein
VRRVDRVVGQPAQKLEPRPHRRASTP